MPPSTQTQTHTHTHTHAHTQMHTLRHPPTHLHTHPARLGTGAAVPLKVQAGFQVGNLALPQPPKPSASVIISERV